MKKKTQMHPAYSVGVKLIRKRVVVKQMCSIKSVKLFTESEIELKPLPSYHRLLSYLGQPKFQDQRSKFLCQLRIATDEVEECGVVNVEGREALAAGECLADVV